MTTIQQERYRSVLDAMIKRLNDKEHELLRDSPHFGSGRIVDMGKMNQIRDVRVLAEIMHEILVDSKVVADVVRDIQSGANP